MSGNPTGRPIGSQNKNTQLAKMLEPHGQAILDKLIDLAKAGDLNAIKICMERLIPGPKDQHVHLDIPESGLSRINDLLQFSTSLLRSVCRGDLTPEQAQSVTSLITANCRMIESAQIESRVAEIEYMLKQRGSQSND